MNRRGLGYALMSQKMTSLCEHKASFFMEMLLGGVYIDIVLYY